MTSMQLFFSALVLFATGYACQVGATLYLLRANLYTLAIDIPGLRSWALERHRTSLGTGLFRYRIRLLLDDPDGGREQRLTVESRLGKRTGWNLGGILTIYMISNESGSKKVSPEVMATDVWKKIRNDLRATINLADPQWIRMTLPTRRVNPALYHEIADLMVQLKRVLASGKELPVTARDPFGNFDEADLSSREDLNRQMQKEKPVRFALLCGAGLAYALGVIVLGSIILAKTQRL